MASIEWSCPITGEKLRARLAPGEDWQPSLSAAGREFVGGEEGEARYWEAINKGKGHKAALAEAVKHQKL